MPAFPLMEGQTVSHYEILEKIGTGGMGEVFKARDTRLNRFLAIKVLPAGKSGDPDRRRRFTQEAQTASALSHPNIITIHDIIHEGDTHYIVMEYVSGRTLLELIPPTGLPVPVVLQYATQMADALSAAHAAGIIHRDLKPANVMVTTSGLVKILDFGLAKLTDPSSTMNMTAAAGAAAGSVPGQSPDEATLTAVPLTVEGSILGTVNYMSPEQAEGKRVDARSDIFSFAAVVYEMATGRRAFQGDSDISTLSAVLRDEATPMSELVHDIPHELEDLVRVCLRKDPNARWQSMKEVEMGLMGLKRRSDAGALHRRQPAPASAAGPASANATRTVTAPAKMPSAAAAPQTKTNTRQLLILGGVAALLVLAAGGLWWWSKHRVAAPAPIVQVVSPAASSTAAPAPAPATESAPPAPVPVETPAVQGTTPPPAAPLPTPGKTVLAPPPRPTSPAIPNAPVIPSAPPPVAEVPKPKSEPKAAAGPSGAVSVGDGLPFRIALADDVPADAPAGQAVAFRVIEDVKVGDNVVIARGANVTGSIVGETGKKKFLGMGGKMTYRLISVESVDGQKLSVRAVASRKADGPTVRPLDTGKYAKAKELAAARGTDYIAYIDGDQSVAVHK